MAEGANLPDSMTLSSFSFGTGVDEYALTDFLVSTASNTSTPTPPLHLNQVAGIYASGDGRPRVPRGALPQAYMRLGCGTGQRQDRGMYKGNLMYRLEFLCIGGAEAKRNFTGIRCTKCGRATPVNSHSPVCAKCGGRLEVSMDLERVGEVVSRTLLRSSRQRGMWKYRDLLPVMNQKSILSLGEGNTNLLRSESLAQILGMRRLFIKDETTNPSGSFLDRGMAVEISRARAIDCRAASCAWSGNLASSMAAYCARGGLRSRAYLPGEIDLGKLYQIVAYGAEIVPSFDKETALAGLDDSEDEYYPVTGRNPFFLEGIKTTAVEVADQLDWIAPDWIVLPVGNGVHLSMLSKGLNEIHQLGLVDSVGTRFLAVQVEGCSPIVDAVKGVSTRKKQVSCSFARDIAVDNPSMAEEAVMAIRATGGDAVAVTEKELLDSVKLLARNEGIFAEPASASTIAGLRRLVGSGVVDRSDTVVTLITGIGLKDPVMARKIATKNRVARNMISKFDGQPLRRRIGESKVAMLVILSEGADYAYSMRKKLGDEWGRKMSLVSVYQHLNELQGLGLIAVEKHERSPERRMRVYYSLTDNGLEFLNNQQTG